jgi:hypothetical protein
MDSILVLGVVLRFNDCRAGYSPRRNAIIAALTSSGRSCWVQWPQSGSMMV